MEVARDAKNDVQDPDGAWAAYRQVLGAYAAMRPLMDAAAAGRIAPDGRILQPGEARPTSGTRSRPTSGRDAARHSGSGAASRPGSAQRTSEALTCAQGDQPTVAGPPGEPDSTAGGGDEGGAAEAAAIGPRIGRGGAGQESGKRKLGFKVDMVTASANLDSEL